MTTINKLSSVDQLVASDQVPVYSSENGDARKASMNVVREFIQDGFVPDGGILATSGFYAMRKIPAAPETIAVTTSYANFTTYDSPVQIFPSGRDSIAGMLTLGEFVAQRDMDAVMFWASLTGTWPTNRDLTIAVLVGTDAAPYEVGAKFIGAGRGAGNFVSAMFSSPHANRFSHTMARTWS